jgi:peroxiredoxin
LEVALATARLLLALVFVLASLTKLADQSGTRQALLGFGMPAALAAPLGLLLPLLEVGVAVALLPTGTAWAGAVGALALLGLFVAAIGVNLALGRRPDCHCFGQLHSAPAGGVTLLRNLVLAGVAGFVIWQGRTDPGPSAVAWVGWLTTAQAVGLLAGLLVLGVFAAQGWVLFNLVRQNGRLLLRVEGLEARLGSTGEVRAPAPVPSAAGLPVGSAAPAFSLAGLHGETLTLEALRAAGKPVLLFFTDPGCGPCTALLPEVGRWHREHASALTLAVISRGDPKVNRAKVGEHGLSQVLLQQKTEVSDAYKAYGTPSAVLIGADGKIASPVASGAEQIRALVTRAVVTASQNGHGARGAAPAPAAPRGLKVGHRAPAFTLPDLTGRDVRLGDFHHKVLLLFWNPGCGFCQRMLPDLKAWEDQPPQGAPGLLVISAGGIEANRAMRLKSPVVLDEAFAVGRQFGTGGTPSAVLIDAKGRVASEVAAGAAAVLALAAGYVQTSVQTSDDHPAHF